MNDLCNQAKQMKLEESSADFSNNLGVELVSIMYSNTKLNYDVCASNLVEVFKHISLRIPELMPISNKLVDSIQV